MKMKYFQALADIKRHYDDVLSQFDRPGFGHRLLETWGIDLAEKEALLEEREMLRYLIGCQQTIVRDKNAQKPSIEVVQRCFTRQLTFLEKIHRCHAYNVNKYSSPIVRNEYKACRHYLFKFSQGVWYEKLPAEILTFENKHPDFHKRFPIPSL